MGNPAPVGIDRRVRDYAKLGRVHAVARRESRLTILIAAATPATGVMYAR